MFRRFRLKIRDDGNRRHECSLKATINCLIRNDGELVGLHLRYLGLQNCYLGFFNKKKIEKKITFLTIFLFQKFSPQNDNFQKKYNMLEGND